jgi:hypothetical protein
MEPMSAVAPIPGKKKARAVALPVPYWLREFALIRLAVVSCAGAIGIGVAAVFASTWYLRDATEAKQQAQQSRDAAYNRFAHVENEKQEIRTFQPQFVVLRDKGLIGEENRLNWVDQIRQIQEQRRLPPLSYEIEPQQPVRMDGRMPLGGYLLRSSRMSLHMDLLHEGDLFNFLEDLRQRSYFAVQECTLKRTGGAQNLPNAPQLAADCKLNWVTLIPQATVKAGQKKKGKS